MDLVRFIKEQSENIHQYRKYRGLNKQRIIDGVAADFRRLLLNDTQLSKLIDVTQYIGVGAFGFVLMGYTRRNIVGRDLVNVQCHKNSLEPSLRLPSLQLLRSQPDAVLLPKGITVAIKVEYNYKQKYQKFQLFREYSLLVRLHNARSGADPGFLTPFLFGCFADEIFDDAGCKQYYSHHFLVTELMQRSVRDLLHRSDRAVVPLASCLQSDPPKSPSLPLATIFSIGSQLLQRLQMLHRAPISVSHNDLKLEHLMFASKDAANTERLILIDFGLARDLRGADEKMKFGGGNTRYSTMFRMDGTYSALTDLESSAYLVARLLLDEFPWDGVRMAECERQLHVCEMKKQLWDHVRRVGAGLRGSSAAAAAADDGRWQRLFFTRRSDTSGNGGAQLMRYMQRVARYIDCSPHLPSSKIDYQYLADCFRV